jgi:hypothetical protein
MYVWLLFVQPSTNATHYQIIDVFSATVPFPGCHEISFPKEETANDSFGVIRVIMARKIARKLNLAGSSSESEF